MILNRQTFYLDAEDTYQGIKHVDMVPNLSAQNLQSIEIGKDFMLSHGYIKNDFDVHEWAARSSSSRPPTEVLEEEWERRSWSKLPEAAASRSRHPARLTPPNDEGVHDMTKSVAEMISEARAQVELVLPKTASEELAAGDAVVRRRPRARGVGHATSTAPSRCHAACWSSSPIPPAPATTTSSTLRGRVIVVLPRRAPGPHSPRSPSKTWATRTSPSSTAASRPGSPPVCRPPSTTATSERRIDAPVPILASRRCGLLRSSRAPHTHGDAPLPIGDSYRMECPNVGPMRMRCEPAHMPVPGPDAAWGVRCREAPTVDTETVRCVG